ncbi:MAG: transglycosylase SLT domain-containing protein [Breznakibacter sp.]
MPFHNKYYAALMFFMVTFGGIGENGWSQPTIPETQIRQKLESLGKQSPIRLDYNKHVQAYIDVYTVKRRDHLSRIIGRSELYFPMFEAYLDKYGLPLELKYLAIVESALDPRAKSSSGAMGLWQFLFHTSRMFDLEVTSFVDERCDPVKSTEAACKYLQYLYRNFNDWHLALAAYNVGIGEVKKAIDKSGKTRFWDLAPYLPEQARGYVPAFIAANYVMATYADYNVVPQKTNFRLYEIDSVRVEKNLSFDQITAAIDLNIDDLSFLNPMFTKNYIPAGEKSIYIALPAVKIPLFIREQKTMTETLPPQTMNNIPPRGARKEIYTVQRGEFFHKIAIRHQCRVEDIMQWNNLKSQNLRAGQQLVIWVKNPESRFFFVKSEVEDQLFYTTNANDQLVVNQ